MNMWSSRPCHITQNVHMFWFGMYLNHANHYMIDVAHSRILSHCRNQFVHQDDEMISDCCQQWTLSFHRGTNVMNKRSRSTKMDRWRAFSVRIRFKRSRLRTHNKYDSYRLNANSRDKSRSTAKFQTRHVFHDVCLNLFVAIKIRSD